MTQDRFPLSRPHVSRRALSRRATLLMLPLAVAGCDRIENLFTPASKRLPGVREPVLPEHNGLELDAPAGTSVTLPPPTDLGDWLQPFYDPSHVIGPIRVSTQFKKLWQNDLGTGNGYRRKLVVQPVISNGVVFTMDVDAEINAFKASTGEFLWLFDPSPDLTDSTNIGGGLSSDGQTLFITTGYGDLIALSQATGKPLWRKNLNAPARSAATVADGVLYLVTLDARLLAFSAKDGTQLWVYQGEQPSTGTGALSVAAPAVDGDFVTAAFESGELVAVNRATGVEIWTDSLNTSRALVAVSDIASVPSPTVIADGKVYALGLDGLMLGVDLKSGRRVWERDIGGFQMPYVAGALIFVYADGHLLALTRDEGTALWIAAIPQYRNVKKKKGAIVWYGPLFAGGKLWMFADNGHVLPISPADGSLGKMIDLGERIAMMPAIANGVWYFIFENGSIAAFT